MSEFGPESLSLIVARLRRARNEDEENRTAIYECLLHALRWKGDAGETALLECFKDLDNYGRSQACVVLGQAGVQDSTDLLWSFYQRVKDDPHESFFVGPLWGLIDLQDARVADALADWLWGEHSFDELFGFLSLAGTERAVLPLVLLSLTGKRGTAQHAAMALLSIAHRIGRKALMVELRKAGPQTAEQQEHRKSVADEILAASPRRAEEYFASFYRGLNADDMARLDQMFDEVQDLIHGSTTSHQIEASSPAAMPGRNDPCWCGSGKKYKHCHWRRERRVK